MSHAVLEAVPNLSEGRDPGLGRAVSDLLGSVPEVELVDSSADPDHNRSVFTVLGPPGPLGDAMVELARLAIDRIDLTSHQGVHPRIGALDVLPFVPLAGTSMEAAVELAHSVGRRIASDVGVPVFLYGNASSPPGRTLAELRRRHPDDGGVGSRRSHPDYAPPDRSDDPLDPAAGAVCVGARGPLLAWNVYLEGAADLEVARTIAARIREADGGFPGLRALGFELESQGRVQVSMNLERPSEVSTADIYGAIDREARRHGARAGATEVIGLIPDEAAMSAAAACLCLSGDGGPGRLISHRVAAHLARRGSGLGRMLDALAGSGPPALGSALAWSAAMAAALIEMSAPAGPRDVARKGRERLMELGDRDSEIYGRFIVSEGSARLKLWRDVTEIPLDIAREARRALDAALQGGSPRRSMAPDLRGAETMLRTIAREAARLALSNAGGAPEPLTDLEAEARRVLEGLKDTEGSSGTGSRDVRDE